MSMRDPSDNPSAEHKTIRNFPDAAKKTENRSPQTNGTSCQAKGHFQYNAVHRKNGFNPISARRSDYDCRLLRLVMTAGYQSANDLLNCIACTVANRR